VAIIPAIASFVPGRRGVSGDEAKAWALELNDLVPHRATFARSMMRRSRHRRRDCCAR
jgi:hypothetical protein